METLFDLDTVAPVAPPAEAQVLGSSSAALGSLIAKRATLATVAINRALSLWARSAPVSPTDPLLSQTFVEESVLARMHVATAAVLEGETAIRFLADENAEHASSVRNATAVRRTPEGILVSAEGRYYVPLDMVPPATTCDGAVFVGAMHHSFRPFHLVGRIGEWGRFRPIGTDEPADFMAPIADTVRVPDHFFATPSPELSDAVFNRFLALHIEGLEKDVAELLTLPVGPKLFEGACALLRAHARHKQVWFPTADCFLPPEAAALAAILDLFQWPVENEKWRGSVSVDPSMGWSLKFTYEGTFLASGETVTARHDALPHYPDTWISRFDPHTRVTAAFAELEKALELQRKRKDLGCPAEAGPAPIGKKRGRKPAPESDMNELRSTISALRSFAVLPAHFEALAGAETALAAGPTADDLESIRSRVLDSFRDRGESLSQTAAELLGKRVWSEGDASAARRANAEYEQLQDIAGIYSDSSRELGDFLQSVGQVSEVAPGWFVALTKGGAHGAVSSTGYHSCLAGKTVSASLTPREATKHLIEDTRSFASSRLIVQGCSATEAFAEWVRALPHMPDDNAVRRTANLIAGSHELRSIRQAAEETLKALSEGTSPQRAEELARLMAGPHVSEEGEQWLGRVAAHLLARRYGPFLAPPEAVEATVFNDTDPEPEPGDQDPDDDEDFDTDEE